MARGFHPFPRQSPQCPRLHPHQLPRGPTSWRPNQDVTSAGSSSAGLQPRFADSRLQSPAQHRSPSPATSRAGDSATPPGARPSFQPLVGICGAEVSPLRGPFLSRLGGWALQQAVQVAALDQLASSGRPQHPTFRTPLLPQRATTNSGSPLWASPSQGPLLGGLPNC